MPVVWGFVLLWIVEMPARQYTNLDLRVEGAGDAFSVRVTSSPVGAAGPLALMLPQPLARMQLLVRLEQWRPRARGPADPESRRDAIEVAVQDIGAVLDDAVFHGVIRDALVGSRCPDGLRET